MQPVRIAKMRVSSAWGKSSTPVGRGGVVYGRGRAGRRVRPDEGEGVCACERSLGKYRVASLGRHTRVPRFLGNKLVNTNFTDLELLMLNVLF